MKALFVHDHKFFVDSSDRVYSSGKLPYPVWQRYLKQFDELTVVGRSLPLGNCGSEKLNLSSGQNVTFVFVPSIATPVSMIRYRRQVVKTLEQLIDTVDAVISRGSLLGNLAASIAERKNKPWAIEVVGCSWDAYWNYGNIKGKLFAPFAFHSKKRLVSRSKFSLYVTRDFLQKRYPCFGVTSGVSNVEIQRVHESVLELREQRIGGSNDPFVFGLIGSLQAKYKGIQTAFSALRMVQGQLPRYELQILGCGNSDPWIELAKSLDIKDNVKFIGTLPGGDAVSRWLDDVDVYLQPSFQEGLPRALVEALSRGCPAIGSTVGGIPELLESSVLHKPGDVRGVADLILQSLDVGWRQHHARKNFKTAQLYTKDILNARRDAFWHAFAEYARDFRA